MPSCFQRLILLVDPLFYSSPAIKAEFEIWDLSTRILHIRAIALLTSSLYLFYAFIDQMMLEGEALVFATTLHLIALPLLLLFIALLTYFNALHKLMIITLIVAPILSNLGNFYLHSYFYSLQDILLYIAYMPEIYLSVIWIFSISGLRFLPALFSVSIVLAGFLIWQFYFPLIGKFFLLQLLWMLAAFSFGFVNALMLERRNKNLFLNAKQLEHLAIYDKLSGLYNRMKIESICKAELDRTLRYKEIFSIALIDIDDFKKINDNFGHNVGDRVIQQISDILQSAIRKTDCVGRWGGEEFLILLPQTEASSAFELIEKIRMVIAQNDFGLLKNITISAGVAEYKDDKAIETIVLCADQALYEAKKEGKNRVYLSNECCVIPIKNQADGRLPNT